MSRHLGTWQQTVVAGLVALTLVGCGSATSTSGTSDSQTSVTAREESSVVVEQADADSEIYTKRDLAQEADISDATYLSVADATDIDITEEGVYVLSGTAQDVTIRVNVDSSEKVQLVLDGLSITNEDAPAIYVLSADKVFITTAEGSENTLATTGTFVADGETALDAVVFSKDDLVLNGLGTLNISSSDNAIVAKDDLKVTGGTYAISCSSRALDANDAVYICGGTFDITAGNDGIRSDELVQIDGGTIRVSGREGIESTYVLIQDGTLSIEASDDGINAGQKSDAYAPKIEIRGGDITIVMAAGDTDALDANGDIVVSGGTLNITAEFAFDFEGTSELTGGIVIVNGEQVDTIENSMMMGGMGDGMAGGMGGPGEPGR